MISLSLLLFSVVLGTASACECGPNAPQLAGVDAYARWFHETRAVPPFVTRTSPLPLEEQRSLSSRVAVVVPYRDRAAQLEAFVAHMAFFLGRAVGDRARYRLFVVEQADGGLFNRGALLNAGFRIATSGEGPAPAFRPTHVIFHDVDALPDAATLLPWYAAPPPRGACYHLASPAWFEGKYTFDTFFGAILSVRPDDFVTANGFPSSFDGWGGEDDALLHRLSAGCDGARNTTTVYRPRRGRFRHLPHPPENVEAGGVSREHMAIARAVVEDQCRWRGDGLSSGGAFAAVGEPTPLLAVDEVSQKKGVVGFLIKVRRQ